MKRSLMQLPFLAVASVCLFVFCFSSLAFAQEDEATPPEPTMEEKLAVPENASPEELEKFIRETQMYMPKSIKTYEQYLEFLTMQGEAVNKAVDLLLASEGISTDQKRSALRARIRTCLQGARDDASTEKSLAMLQKIIDDAKDDEEMQTILDSARQTVFQIRMNAFLMGENKNRDEFMQLDRDLREYFADKDKTQFTRFAPAMLEIASSLYADQDDFIDVLDKLATQYVSMVPESAAERLEGLVRRCKLPGNEMELKTVTIDVKKLIDDAGDKEDFDVMKWAGEQPAKQLDIKSLEGKVVLVDCWATWCGPCLGEIPNMLKQYDKYHEKGFEIIGYSCDQDVSALLNFVRKENPPWIIGSTVLSKKEELKNYLDYYGVSGIPTMILVGRDGKVISTKARGETLNKLLEEQFAE